MPNIIDTLEQTKMWYCQDGMPMTLDEMEPSHKSNVLAFLLRRADNLYRHKVWRDAYLLGEDIGHQLPQDPVQWLTATPLMQELARRLNEEGSIEPDSLQIEMTDVDLLNQTGEAHDG